MGREDGFLSAVGDGFRLPRRYVVGTVSEATDHLRADKVLEGLKSWMDAYPEHVFLPLEGDSLTHTGDYETSEQRSLISRASACMGRHMIERAIKPAVKEIERLEAELVQLRKWMDE